jgi:ABC-type antimicrobial peptide transport system permease subunit
VLAFSVSTRTNDIGVRMSLGADRWSVQRMILAEGGVLIAIGLVLGVGGALFAMRLIRGLLFDVPPYDPVTMAIVSIAMLVVGVTACWFPARRASLIDPVQAIRSR